MKKTFLSLLGACLLAGPVSADVYFFNTTDEQFTYEVTLPNGDTEKGNIKHDRGYGPAQSDFDNKEGDKTHFKIFREDGTQCFEGVAPYYRAYVIGAKGDQVEVAPASWYRDNGQKHKRVMDLYNATGKAQTFDIIDEKEVRKGITLQPGERKTVMAKNGFNGSSGFHTIKFDNGHRSERECSSGYFVIMYNDKRSPGKVQVSNYGHVTIPRNTTE